MQTTSLIRLTPLLLVMAIQPANASDQCQGTLIGRGQLVVGDSFVAPLVEIFGDVYIGGGSFVAGNTILRAAPNLRVCLGSATNLQDNIIVRALGKSTDIGSETSLAHHGVVRGSELGNFVFIGFNAQVSNSVIEDGAFILHGAYVERVTIPENRIVGIGQVVLTQAEADALPEAPETTEEFRREVLDVNTEFASSYINLYHTEGYESVTGIDPNPATSFNPEQLLPHIGENVELQEFVHVVGDVRLGANSEVGQRSAIRADEGSPIVIGAGAELDDRVTFHALKGTNIRIGDNLTAQDDVVFHGPLVLGSNVTVDDEAVVFQVNIEDDVKIGEQAVVVGPEPEDGQNLLAIPTGAVIPDGAVITSEADLRDVLSGGDGSRDEDRDDIPTCPAC